MRILKAIFTICLLHLFMLVQAQQKEVNADIKAVTVFYQGAQLQRITPDISIPAGQSVILVKGLEQYLNESSLRLGVNGQAKILNIVKTTDYLDQQSSSARIEELTRELEQLDKQIENLRVKVKVFDYERNLLISNMQLGGANTGVNVSQIIDGANFYRTRLLEIENSSLEVSREIKIKEEQKRKISAQLNDLNYKKNRPTSTIEISLEAEKAGTCSLLLDYLIPQASWYTSYDVRIDDVNGPVKVMRKAKIRQQSGSDWKKVGLVFSTGNPMEQQEVPVLNPWYVDFYTPVVNYNYGYLKSESVSKAKRAQAVPMVISVDEEVAVEDFDMAGGQVFFEQGSTHSVQEFRLPGTADISQDGKEYTFSLGTDELQAEYHYKTIPKLEKAAYLVATVTDWEGYELVDGPANIYYDKMFIGETHLTTTMTLDSLELSMGKDKGIIIERKTVKDFMKVRTLGANVRKSFGYEIIIRNTKSSAINLIVEDQLPISNNSQIEVDIDELSGGKHNETNGKITWKLELKAGESINLPFRYSIKYPKDSQINL